ncbi:AAA-associated domain-containing protein [Anaeromyxobacter sp. SG17]|uniref:AAA-associated domain-containing protein n=1 Tax=Anaeromyxobacter sp. SG17 TaxID=2925405 RepID=UPI001F59E1F6|nr:AAA-associated domain-containing protein [Anaeromyxobacter sp. SG17]
MGGRGAAPERDRAREPRHPRGRVHGRSDRRARRQPGPGPRRDRRPAPAPARLPLAGARAARRPAARRHHRDGDAGRARRGRAGGGAPGRERGRRDRPRRVPGRARRAGGRVPHRRRDRQPVRPHHQRGQRRRAPRSRRQRFVRAPDAERRAIWRERLLGLGLFRQVQDAIARSPGGRVERDFVLELIAVAAPREDFEAVFERFVSWASYGGLFLHDAAAQVLTAP